VILYTWTAVAAGSPEYRGSVGVSDDGERARLAAEPYLRTGLARLAYVESVRTAMSAHSLSPQYVPTGVGWWATPAVAPAGVEWVRYTDPVTAGGLRALAESAGCDADDES
jgi:hypothetical protein